MAYFTCSFPYRRATRSRLQELSHAASSKMRPPMLLGESTPLNKERGGQRSKALVTARGLKRKPRTLLVANTR